MAEPFKNKDEIEAWLNTQPRDVISVFAARVALRAVPQFARLIENEKLKRPADAIILLSLWAISTALSGGIWPDKVMVSQAAAADAVHTADSYAANDAAAYAAYATYATSATSASSAAHAVYTAAYAASSTAASYAAADAAGGSAGRARASVYKECSWDCDFIEKGQSAEKLSMQKLWSADTYFDVHQADVDWEELKSYLEELNSDWEVWTEWYEARLEGQPLIEEIEIGLDPENGQYGRATLPSEYYENPAKANAAIKKIFMDYWERQGIEITLTGAELDEKSDVPPQNPASIKPVIRNGKIFLSDKPLDADLEIELAIANMLALRDEFEEFFTSMESESNFDKRPLDFLKTITALIPNGIPDSRVLFRLIRKEAAMEKYEATVLEEWPQFFADRYSSLLTELGQVLDQFPDRRAFQRHKLSAEIEAVDFKEFNQDFAPVLDAIKKEDEIIDSTVPVAIRAIGELSDGPPEQDEQRVIIADQLDSTNNLLKALTDEILDPISRQQAIVNIGNAYASGFVEGVPQGAKQAGLDDGKISGASIGRAEAAKTVGKALHEKYPERFSWIKRRFRKRT